MLLAMLPHPYPQQGEGAYSEYGGSSSSVALRSLANLAQLTGNCDTMMAARAFGPLVKLLRSTEGRCVDFEVDYEDPYEMVSGEPAISAAHILAQLVGSPSASSEVEASGLVAAMLSLLSDMLRAEVAGQKQRLASLESMDADERAVSIRGLKPLVTYTAPAPCFL